jgi:hypothetical protein
MVEYYRYYLLATGNTDTPERPTCAEVRICHIGTGTLRDYFVTQVYNESTLLVIVGIGLDV